MLLFINKFNLRGGGANYFTTDARHDLFKTTLALFLRFNINTCYVL